MAPVGFGPHRAELAEDADRIAEGVAEQQRWDALDRDGIEAIDERTEWSAELAAELRERARQAREE